MKIIAASIAQTMERFLHAGYGSSMSRNILGVGDGASDFGADGTGFPAGNPRHVLDMAEALRLKGETLASGAASGAISTWQVLAGIAILFGAVALVYLLRGRRSRQPRRGLRPPLSGLRPLLRGGAVGLALLAPLLLVGWGAGDAENSAAKTAYENPRQATLALMHGILADAVTNMGTRASKLRIRSLDEVKGEVGLPTKELTAGMKHALQHYTLDGWGRPFRIKGGWYSGFRVESAGADGKFKTRDDLRMRVYLDDDQAWEGHRHAFFVRKLNNKRMILFHRSRASCFDFCDEKQAKAVTGTKLFDIFAVKELPKKVRWRMQRLHNKVARAAKHEPLVMMAAFR